MSRWQCWHRRPAGWRGRSLPPCHPRMERLHNEIYIIFEHCRTWHSDRAVQVVYNTGYSTGTPSRACSMLSRNTWPKGCTPIRRPRWLRRGAVRQSRVRCVGIAVAEGGVVDHVVGASSGTVAGVHVAIRAAVHIDLRRGHLDVTTMNW